MSYTFLICTERSGSNLLNRMLSNHSRVCAPSPTHLFRRLVQYSSLYENLAIDTDYYSLLDDALNIFNSKIGIWNAEFDFDELRRMVRNRSIASVVDYFYRKEARLCGKQKIFVKEVNTTSFYPFLQSNFPNSKFVYMTRDPRDVALSWKKSNSFRGCVIRAAKRWKEEQILNIDLVESKLDNTNVHHIKYEDLIKEPELELRGVCAEIEIDYEPTMLDYYKSPEYATEYPEEWRNLNRPLLEDNAGKYRSELSMDEIAYIEAQCHRQMKQLGYSLEFDLDESATSISKRIMHLELYRKPGFDNVSNEIKRKLAVQRSVISGLEHRRQSLLREQDI